MKNNFPFDQFTSGSWVFNQSKPRIILEEPVSVTLKVIRSEWPPIFISMVHRRLMAPALF